MIKVHLEISKLTSISMSQIFKNCLQMFESYQKKKKKKSFLYKNMNNDCKCVSCLFLLV